MTTWKGDAPRSIKFGSTITVSANCPTLVHQKDVNLENIAFSFSIGYPFLRDLQRAKVENNDFSYINIVNSQLLCCQLKDSSRLEGRFRRLCSDITVKYKVRGRKRKQLDGLNAIVAVCKEELQDITNIVHKYETILSENIHFEEKCKCLYISLSECKNVLSDKENAIESLTENNERLNDYISRIQHHSLFVNQGQSVSQLGGKQVKRKLIQLKSHASKALWFAETFGLTPKTLQLSTETGKTFRLDLACEETVPQNYDINLDREEKEKIRKLVYLLDKFCISDAAYHELAVLLPEMPRKYIIVECRKDLNSIFHIQAVPGNIPGAMISFKAVLEDAVKTEMQRNNDKDTCKVKVKFSGDGANVSRISNFVVFSLSIISAAQSLYVQEQKCVAILQCKEDYCNFRYSCKPMFDEVNEVITEKCIQIDGKDIETELFLGGDMKFLQIVLGLNSSQSNYACIWCKVSKEDRWDTSKPCDYYHGPDLYRSMDDLIRLSSPLCNDKLKYGVIHKPLLHFDMDHVVMDELHLMLRITDILIRNLIDDCVDLDVEHKVKGEASSYLQKLVEAIKECGVSFEVWKSKEIAGDLNWTSLSGVGKKKVLKLLPPKLPGIIHENTCNVTVKVWEIFCIIYDVICGRCDVDLTSGEVFQRCKEWLDMFLSLGSNRKGYQKKNVTPYMHCLLYHVPMFRGMHGTLSQFSGQAVEKTNDEIKKIHQRKSKKWSQTAEALQVRKRIEDGCNRHIEREKRVYEKRKLQWWNDEIFRQRGEMKLKIRNETVNNSGPQYEKELELQSMSPAEIKEKVRELGLRTNLRSREKLLEVLRDATSSS